MSTEAARSASLPWLPSFDGMGDTPQMAITSKHFLKKLDPTGLVYKILVKKIIILWPAQKKGPPCLKTVLSFEGMCIPYIFKCPSFQPEIYIFCGPSAVFFHDII